MVGLFNRVGQMSRQELWRALRRRTEQPILRLLTNQEFVKSLPERIADLVEVAPPPESGQGLEQDLHRHFRQRRHPALLALGQPKAALLALIDTHAPGRRTAAVEAADRIRDHQFTIFGVSHRFQQTIDWHLDITNGARWPKSFAADIPYGGPGRLGDIKYPWELSRHQYFITLGKAYWYTGNERYAEEFVGQVTSWIDDNPVHRGIHWISPLEAAIRIIHWILAFHLFRASPRLSADFTSLLLRSLWTQARFIERQLTSQRYANNHLIGEAAGLFLGGLFLCGFKGAEEWAELGRTILLEEIERQTHPDGVNVEQASSYQRFVMDFFVLFKLLHEGNIGPLPSAADQRLERMFGFLAVALRPDGQLPPYGDGDDARGLALADDRRMDSLELLAVGAALYGNPEWKWTSRNAGEMIIWLLGEPGIAAYDRLHSRVPPDQSALFPDGGYAILRSGWGEQDAHLLFDVGPLGYRTAAHGHADALSVQLFGLGSDLLVDPGTFAYNQDQPYRNYFRSTRAHNTITVDGKDQAEMAGRMAWATRPEARLTDHFFSAHFDLVTGQHGGYLRLASPVLHRRTVVFNKSPLYYLLIDRLETDGPHEFGLHFHTPPSTTCELTEPLHAALPGGRHLLFFVRGAHALQWQLREGEPEPAGWYSPGYGQRVPSPSLSCQQQATGAAYFLSLILPYRGERPAVTLVDGAISADAAAIRLVHNGIEDTWFLNPASGAVTYGDITFEGRTGLVRRHPSAAARLVCGREITGFAVGHDTAAR